MDTLEKHGSNTVSKFDNVLARTCKLFACRSLRVQSLQRTLLHTHIDVHSLQRTLPHTHIDVHSLQRTLPHTHIDVHSLQRTHTAAHAH
jgi:hypothetical protein